MFELETGSKRQALSMRPWGDLELLKLAEGAATSLLCTALCRTLLWVGLVEGQRLCSISSGGL